MIDTILLKSGDQSIKTVVLEDLSVVSEISSALIRIEIDLPYFDRIFFKIMRDFFDDLLNSSDTLWAAEASESCMGAGFLIKEQKSVNQFLQNFLSSLGQ